MGFFKNLGAKTRQAVQGAAKPVARIAPVIVRRALPPGVGAKALQLPAKITHAVSVNLDNINRKKTCIKSNAVKLGGAGLGAGAVFGPWGAVIGTAAGAAAGAGVALAAKDCNPGEAIGPLAEDPAALETVAQETGQNPATVTAAPGSSVASYTMTSAGTVAPNGQNGGLDFFGQIQAFLASLTGGG